MLTSLELFGFKSFADRTLFEFSPGITCVVGPNGSGKSNVVDAIKWILGDQSPKSLRGKEMADVIFNGSSGRKPSGFAEATLAFDNRQGLFPVPDVEVRVGRRLYRSGDSEYLLNGAVVRLKDVRDLFLGTGAGTAAYSIIEQGRVDQILQANPSARRIVFEEAAGISRFKARRIEAERKLEKVAQNLLRLTDIVDEVEAQLTATRSQASKAARYRELSLELKTLWTGLAADDFRRYTGRLAEAEHEERQQTAELEQLSAEIAAVEARRADIAAQCSAIEAELKREERRLAGVREQLAAGESTIRHQSRRDTELTAEIDRLRGERLALAAQAAAVESELRDTQQRLAAIEQRVTEQREALAARRRQCDDCDAVLTALQAETAAHRGRRDAIGEQLAALQHETTRLSSQLELLDRARSELQQRRTVVEAQLATAEQELHTRRERTTASEQEHLHRLADVDAARAARQTLADARSELETALAAGRERRSAAVARIHVLEDLERRQEGISIGVREMLRRAHDSPHPPWNEIIGSVSDLVQVALVHAPLVEVALGGRSQLVVVRRLSPVVDFLHRQAVPIAGRVGFLELQRTPQTSNEDQSRTLALLGRPGVVCRADELLEEFDEAAGLAAQLLHDTWIVESLPAALTLHREFPGRRFVTQQGELVERDGVLYAGVIPNTTALVSRRSELRDLKHEVIRLDREQEQGALRSVQLGRQLQEAESRLEAAESRAAAAAEELTLARGRLDRQTHELRRLSAEAAELAERQQAHEQQAQEIAASLAAAAERRTTLLAQQQVLEQTIAAFEQRTRDSAAEVARLRDELKEQQLELARHGERLSSLREVLNRLTADQQQRLAGRSQAERRLKDACAALSQTRLTILQTRSGLDSGFLTVEDLGRQVARRSADHRRLRGEAAAFSAQEEELHRRRRRLEDGRHQTEIRIRELRRDLQAIDERIREEYQQPLAEFVDAGASALRQLIAERYPDGTASEVEPDAPTAGSSGTTATTETVARRDPGDGAPIEFEAVRGELEEQVNRLRRKIKLLGSVNTDALSELDELESRFAALSAQRDDLQAARDALEEIIRRINKESRRIFLETFESIRENFRTLFRKVFGGGEGDIILEDPDNVLDCGIDIVARPPGKELRSISLLSGGEKTMTAVALLFAMFKSKPSPYCILDEVDAALDEANVDRYVGIVREFAGETQFVVITHRKRTMTAADVLYGVTMEQAGVSKRMSVRFEDVGDDGRFDRRAAA